MRLSVSHRTTYKFDAPMRFVTQSHRIFPSQSDSQNVVSWDVAVEGAAFGAEFRDGAGDLIRTMTIEGPVEQVEILITGVVETTDTAGILRNHRETISPRVYLESTAVTLPNRAFEALLEKSVGAARDEGELAVAHALSAAISEAIAYVPGETDSGSTAAEALEQGKGVCQDQAHALITLAHLAGLPARYVTGYLLSGSDGEMEDASHGWAELHLQGLGWVGFDPANECCPDERYIRLGSGRDAVDAAPIRGVTRGGGGEAMDVSVVISQQ